MLQPARYAKASFFSPGGKHLDFILYKTGSHRFLTKAVHDYYFINIHQTGCQNGLLWGEKIEVGRSIKRIVNLVEGDDEQEEDRAITKGKIAFEMTFQGMN